ncbi:MAG: ABC transporter permease [Candidatus Staskawiczbacteria bacterium]|nr:ABC transporter permease [Candidatus Staskawiczbacteria bacterium]
MAKIDINNLKEYLKIAVKTISTRRIRSWLTTIGIVIGVFLIVSLLSLSQGLKNAVLQQLNMMGKDLITIMPGDITNVSSMMSGQKLTDADLKIIKETEGVDIIVAMDYTSVVARYDNQKKTVLIYGADWRNDLDIFKNDMGWSVSQGQWPSPGRAEVVVGSIVASDTFGGLRVGNEIVIKGRKFIVAGILNSVGSKQDDSMIGVDSNIFQSITGERNGAKMTMAKIEAGYSADFVAEKLKSNLNENRKRQIGQKENDSSYTVLTSATLSSIVGNVMGLIQAVIIGFASIAIVVGGIGIMNTMYTSVSERTKEIGIMKAIGAKNRTIITIFLIESGIFGMLGGVGGTLLGLIFAKTIEIYFQIHPLFYLRADVSPGLILFSLSFSFVIGCVSGYFPARAAAKLKPVDALRYE